MLISYLGYEGADLRLGMTSAHAAASFTIDYSLDDDAVMVPHLHNMAANNGDVLTYDSSTSTWGPRALSGINLLGTWNAFTNNPTLVDGGAGTNPLTGDFYVVGVSGSSTIDAIGSWQAGDWILFNGTTWERITNSSGVTSFNGRQGTIMPQAGDYSWNMLDKSISSIGDIANVDTSSTPPVGSVLRWNGAKWLASEDDTGQSPGAVTSTAINDGSITNDDINASANIAQSKISGLTSDLGILNASTTANRASIISVSSSVSVLNASSTSQAATYSDNNSDISFNQTILNSKQDILATGTAGQYFRGDKTWQNLITDVVPEGSNLYFTQARTRSTVLAGYSMATTSLTLMSSDTVSQGLAKVEGQVNAITNSTSTGDFKKDGSVAMTGNLNLSSNAMRFRDNDGLNHYATLSASTTMSTDLSFILPQTSGNSGQVLSTDGSGNLSWIAPPSNSGDVTAVQTGGSSGLSGGNTSGDIALSVNVDNSSIEINSNTLRVKDGGIANGMLASGVSAAKITAGLFPTGVYSTSVSLLGSGIDANEITDYTITNADISSSTKIAWTKIDTTSATSGGIGAAPLTRNLATATTTSGLMGGGTLAADRDLSAKVDNKTIEISTSYGLQVKNVVESKTSNYTVVGADMGKYLLVENETAITLPSIASVTSGSHLIIKNIGEDPVTIIPNGANLIEGQDLLVLLSTNTNATLVSNGSAWYAYHSYGSFRKGFCPEGFVRVPGNATLGTTDFCVMQYEARNSGGVPSSKDSTAGSAPWTNIYAPNAQAECETVSEPGFEGEFTLISNPEWMTIARNIESQGTNWSGGSVGSGHIARGSSDNSPASVLAISSLTDPYNGTGNNSGQAAGSGWEQKRLFNLSTGKTIWDFAGNAWEFVDWDASSSGFTNGPIDASSTWRELTTLVGSITANDLQSLGGYTSAKSIGRWNGGASGAGSAVRGGAYFNGSDAGPFSLRLDLHTADGWNDVGFRCVYRP